MSTTLVNVANEHADKWLDSAPKRKILTAIHKKMRSGYYRQSWLELVVSPRRYSHYDMGDAYAWMSFQNLFWAGKVLMAEVMLPDGHEPFQDKQSVGNNEMLSRLPAPFTAEFVGGQYANHDGSFTWSKPILLTRTTDVDGKIAKENVRVEPQSIPLEVGSVKTYNTLEWILSRDGCARWPYGSSVVTILVADRAAMATLLGNDSE